MTIERYSWPKKLALAFRGIAVGMRGQRSFHVHLPVAVSVVVAGLVLKVSHAEWCLLTLCIAMVLGAELFNSALESLTKAITRDENPHIADALDIASGAVLVVACGAAVVGLLVLVA